MSNILIKRKYLISLSICLLFLTSIFAGSLIGKTYAAAPKLMKLHFISVGQADSILIQTPGGKNMLIDAGNNEDSKIIQDYLKAQKINKIDALIATHPHEDHIGAMDDVIKAFPIGIVYMPNVKSTTATYNDMINAIKAKKLTVNTPVAGKSIVLDPAIKIDILAPNSSKYEDLNNYSIVLKITYGKNSFLLTGDAEEISEREMIAKKYNLKADLLKVGHHGSKSSTIATFLSAVKPTYAVISVGKGNDYGHPEKLILDKLSVVKSQVFRTDLVGTIVATSDGTTIKIDKKASPVKINAPPTTAKPTVPQVKSTVIQNATVYVTKTGEKYHKDGCRSLSKSKIPKKLSEVKGMYDPCSVCKPPQ
jgi:competence protein ComEC